MTTVMNNAHDVLTDLSVADVLDYYTEQVNAAVAANRPDVVRELAAACEDELASVGHLRRAA